MQVPYGAFTFLDLPKVVAFQRNMLVANGSDNPTTAPQAMLAATEQNWAANPNNNCTFPYQILHIGTHEKFDASALRRHSCLE